MKFGTSKNLLLGLLLTAFVIALAGQFLTEEGTAEYTLSLVMALVMLALAVVAGVIWGRCPNCGKRLFFQLLKWKSCPKCRRPLDPNGRYRPVVHGRRL